MNKEKIKTNNPNMNLVLEENASFSFYETSKFFSIRLWRGVLKIGLYIFRISIS
jgi:hypothetical protein